MSRRRILICSDEDDDDDDDDNDYADDDDVDEKKDCWVQGELSRQVFPGKSGGPPISPTNLILLI